MQRIESGERLSGKKENPPKKSQSLDVRQQETERESIHPESEKDISSHVSESVKDPTTRPLPIEVDSSVDSIPVPLDLSELCAEHSDQELAFLRPQLNESA